MADRPSVPWEQAIRVARLATAVAFAELLVIAALVGCIVYLFPLKEKVPVYVEFQDGSNHFVVVARGQDQISTSEAVLSREMKSYVVDRERIDKTTENERYDRVFRKSDKDTWEAFWSVAGNKNISLFYKKGVKRDIEVTRWGALSPNTFQLEYKTIDSQDGSSRPSVINEWVATIKFRYVDQKIAYEERDLNPLGLEVTQYTVVPRRT